MPDDVPDGDWTSEQILLWLSREVTALRRDFRNHLSQHFRTNMVLLGGAISFAAALAVILLGGG